MADLTLLPEETHPRVNIADWMIRLGVAIVFLIAGAEKFSATNPNSHWVSMFNQIGIGEWFRYFTAVIEVRGAAFRDHGRRGRHRVLCPGSAWREPVPRTDLPRPASVGLEALEQVVPT